MNRDDRADVHRRAGVDTGRRAQGERGADILVDILIFFSLNDSRDERSVGRGRTAQQGSSLAPRVDSQTIKTKPLVWLSMIGPADRPR